MTRANTFPPRRTFLRKALFGLPVAAFALSSRAFAQIKGGAAAVPFALPPNIPQQIDGGPVGVVPYEFIQPPVREDFRTVRLLFAYTCPFCRQYHSGIVGWGKTIPPSLQFASTPIISGNNDNEIYAVMGRIIVENMAPAKLDVYDALAYGRVQDDPSALNTQGLLNLLDQTGIEKSKLETFFKNAKFFEDVQKKLPYYAQVVQIYGLSATPTVAIAGKIRVTPDNANGNPQQFLMLLNGLVSRILEQQKSAPAGA